MYHECGCLYWLASNAFKTIIILLEVAIWLNAVYNLALPIRLHRFGSLLWRELETDIVLRPHQIKHIKRIAYIMLTGYKGREIKNFTFYQNYYYNMAWIWGYFFRWKSLILSKWQEGSFNLCPRNSWRWYLMAHDCRPNHTLLITLLPHLSPLPLQVQVAIQQLLEAEDIRHEVACLPYFFRLWCPW